MLQNELCTVTMCDKHTKDLKRELTGADIVITATGVPHLITAEMVEGCSPDVVVIDAGFSKVEGKLVGDVDFENVKDRVGAITPVPGGVGPMTVAILTRNLLKAARMARGDTK
jgi:methylenetetrahydrofolate dehydrogenase (NADP+)/methenyltetrahydrofolate cyclohydrolase